MSENESIPKVLIVGGGIAGLEAALALRALCGKRVDIGMIAPKNTYTYRPLAVAEPFGLAEKYRINLNVFATSKDVDVHHGEVDSVDLEHRRVHATNGTSYDYDYLIMAVGAVRKPALADAISFDGFAGVQEFEHLLHQIENGAVRAVTFCAGAKNGWFLPMYELTLMTATFAVERNAQPEITVVTPESAPLISFGAQNSAAVSRMLNEAGITVRTDTYPTVMEEGELRFVPDGSIEVDAVVAMPSLEGPALAGLPSDGDGFIPVDQACRIAGCEREFAAGDATDFPVKQGGIAAQMATAVVRAIAVDLGVLVDARPFRPTLDGTLLTGKGAHHMHQSLVMGTSQPAGHQVSATWLPLAKISAPFLCDYLGDHSAFPGGKSELDSDAIAESLSKDWERDPMSA